MFVRVIGEVMNTSLGVGLGRGGDGGAVHLLSCSSSTLSTIHSSTIGELWNLQAHTDDFSSSAPWEGMLF